MADQQAVLEQYSQGQRAVLAAPGAGKTTLISRLIAHWIESEHVASQRILVLTFTESAAREFEQRTLSLLPPFIEPPVFSTIHGFCNRLLRQLDARFSDRGVASEERRYRLLDDILQAAGVWSSDLDYARLLADVLIPRYRQQPFLRLPTSAAELEDWTGVPSEHAELLLGLPRWLAHYEARLAQENLLDYDMMISATYDLLCQRPQVLEHLRQRYTHILEDEAQDSNRLQTQVLQLIAGEQGHWLRVGDPNQSIYSFSGADFQELTRFAQQQGVFAMQQSNRSSLPIMDLANRFHSRHSPAFPSPVYLAPGVKNPDDGWIWARLYTDTASELEAVLQAAQNLLQQNLSVAILCRTNLSGQWLYDHLRAAHLPAVLHHDRSEHFFQSDGVRLLKRILDYLLQADQFHLLQQVLLELGHSRQLLKTLLDPRVPVAKQLRQLAQGLVYHPTVAGEAYAQFVKHCQSLLFLIEHLYYPIGDLLEWITERLVFSLEQRMQLRLLYNLWQQTHQQPIQDLERFRLWLDQAASRKIKQALIPVESEESLTEPGVVHVLTAHKAKGLEWDGVLLPLFQFGQSFRSADQELRILMRCLQQGLPYQTLLDAHEEAEEQENVRLVYVAITRARRFLSFTSSREANRAAGIYQHKVSPLFESLYACYREQKGESA